MAIIKASDFIQSIQDALQYISYYHPKDFIIAMNKAYQNEKSQAAKDAIAQILINSRMAALAKRPICQDTGMVCVFVEVGMEIQWDDCGLSIQEMIDEGVRKAYNYENNKLRASMVNPPHGKRKNTQDNTPAVVHFNIVKGNKVKVKIAAKGGGSEFKSKFTVLNPSDSVVDWVLKMLPTMGAGWCPPGIIAIGIGGTAEKAMLLAKDSLNDHIDIHELQQKGPSNSTEELRLELYEKINALGVGAQGLGGLTTVLDVKVSEYPTHAACKPVALIPNCAATRHISFTLDGNGPALLSPPSLDHWPKISGINNEAKKLDINNITQKEIEELKAGETLLLSGNILTGRDAAHNRLQEMAKKGETLPVDFQGRFIYYVGPVDPVGDEAVGPAGPTTATRMDKFTDFMLYDLNLMGMIGKSERGERTIQAIKKRKAIYLMAVGGAAFLIAKSIRKAKVVAFEDLGMEAIYEFEVEDMPVTVAVDANGTSVHKDGPLEWKRKIAQMKQNKC